MRLTRDVTNYDIFNLPEGYDREAVVMLRQGLEGEILMFSASKERRPITVRLEDTGYSGDGIWELHPNWIEVIE